MIISKTEKSGRYFADDIHMHFGWIFVENKFYVRVLEKFSDPIRICFKYNLPYHSWVSPDPVDHYVTQLIDINEAQLPPNEAQHSEYIYIPGVVFRRICALKSVIQFDFI